MTLGAEPKKVALLSVLVVGILAAWFWNSSGDSSSSAPSSPAVSNNPASVTPAPSNPAPPRTRGRVANSDFTARVPGSRPDDHIDPSSIDPKLQLDLLAKVQAVPPIEGGRNLFQFAAAPAPDKPLPKVPDAPHIAINQPQPKPITNVLSSERSVPAAPPINLKYYGYTLSKSDGRKKAMLLDGDDIIFGTENQTVKQQRYRIVRITTTSIDIEDTQFKSTQTLKIQEPPT